MKAMQQRLSELLLIPDQIQETLLNVAKTMQKFLPPGSLIVTDPAEIELEDVDQYDDSYRFDEKNEIHVDEGSTTDDEIEGELADEEIEDEAGSIGGGEDVKEEKEVEPAPAPEPEKANPLAKWPWTSHERNTFKRSNFQGYRSSSMIQNR